MKTEELEKLRKSIEENGFEYHITDLDKDQVIMIIQKKDPWEGVEFVECIVDSHPHTDPKKGRIYKVSKIPDGLDYIILNDFNVGLHKSMFKPSNQEAYIEQLKEIAYDKFGEIKDGDRFINPNGGKDKRCKEAGWAYRKELDWLYYGTCMLYKQGKWATKLPERVRVEFHDWEYRNSNTANVSLIFHIPKWSEVQDKDDIGEHLAKQLENYLNNEKQD